nr:oxygenase MpaB family protein [Prauserella aidingensis]
MRRDVVVGAGLLAAAANIIMQLARPGVGYGVVESNVDDGNVYKRPFKRGRTTLTYLAVAMLGTDEERRAYRRAVNKQHAQVRSDASSPVEYNAFDPELQLWVAACLYKGFEDIYVAYLGDLPADKLDDIYRSAAPLGTTLQVREDMWPESRAAFEEYWQRNLAKVHIDDTVRDYLHGIATASFFPKPLHLLLRRFNLFVTTGFLPEEFRDQMRLTWTPRQQRRFDAMNRMLGRVIRALPLPLRAFPYNAYLWDVRRRLRTGKPLV